MNSWSEEERVQLFYYKNMIKIISFIDSYKHFSQPIEEFQKRLWKTVDIVKIKPSKYKQSEQIINDESKTLATLLQKTKWYKVLLYIDSKQISTPEFTQLIENTQSQYADIVFIIGWAYGVDDSIADQVDMKLSFSPMTFPHAQALMMLLEQIYRAQCIKRWTGYHHE